MANNKSLKLGILNNVYIYILIKSSVFQRGNVSLLKNMRCVLIGVGSITVEKRRLTWLSLRSLIYFLPSFLFTSLRRASN